MNTTEYYYLDPENKPHGPHSLEALQQMLADGTLSPDTPVSYLGGTSWQPLNAVCSNLPEIPPMPAGTPAALGMAGKEHYSDSMSLFEVFYFVVFKNYLNFRGRATRREYWGFVFINFLATLVVSLASVLTVPFASNIYSLLIALPSIAVQFRRLHDVGRSGWWYGWLLISFIPYIIMVVYSFVAVLQMQHAIDESAQTPEEYGALFDEHLFAWLSDNLLWVGLSVTPCIIISVIVFIFTLLDSQKGTNKYGPSYKYPD